MKSGIYKITCLKNNKIYIGSAVNLEKRWKRHLGELRSGKHHNIILLNAFKRYGEANFVFEIIESVDRDELVLKENEYLLRLSPFGKNGFNISKESRGANYEHNPNKDLISKKISKSKTGKNLSSIHKEQISKTLKKYYFENSHKNKGKNFNEIYGKEKANKIKEKISKNNKTKGGKLNPFFGKTHTKEVRKKIKEAKIGKYFGKQNIKVIIDEKEYSSFGEAAKVLNTYSATIRERCLSNSKKYENYKIKK